MCVSVPGRGSWTKTFSCEILFSSHLHEANGVAHIHRHVHDQLRVILRPGRRFGVKRWGNSLFFSLCFPLTSQEPLQLQQSNPWQSPPCRCCSCRWGRRTCQTFGLMLPQSASRRTACKCPWDQRGNSTDALKVLRVRIESTQCKRAGRRIRFYRSDHQIVSFL